MRERYVVSWHSMMRYVQRIGGTMEEVHNSIKYDLATSRIKKTIDINEHRHLFDRDNREFIFVKGKDSWVLKTVVKREEKETQEIIRKRTIQSLLGQHKLTKAN